jgi:O-antigen/teichoic acid export membrane protein
MVVILPYKLDTTVVCCVMGLMMFPFSLWNITEAIFLAQSKMHFQLASTAPIYIARVFLVIWVLQNGGNLIEVSAVLVASECLVLLMQWLFAVRLVKPKWQIDWQFLIYILKNARILLMVEGLAVLSARIQVVILSLLASEAVVGIYGAILQILLPFHIFSYSLMSIVFPILSKQVEETRERQQKTIEKTLIVLLCVSLPAIVGLFFQGSNLLALLYRNSAFTNPTTNTALIVVSLDFVILAFQQPLSLLLVANNLERFNLYEVRISIFTSAILAIALIPKYQLVGAAVATTIAGALGAIQYIYYAWRYVCPFDFWRVTCYPTLLAAAMVIVFYGLQTCQQNLVTTLVVATIAYSILCSLLLVHVFGGISKTLNFRRLS